MALARTLVSLFAAAVCVLLIGILRETDWTMDADEAVHAIEGLRLYDDLASGRLMAFVHDGYFAERWAPPVNDHLRWYPPVHALCLVPSFLVFGPSDLAARLPSVVFLFATAMVFFALARRLSSWPATSGFLAVVLLLTAPNVLTFSAQCMIATASLFFSFAALYAYLLSLEADHAPRRAVFAGLVLGMAMLCKYDHGGILALALGTAELVRVRFSLARFLRSRAAVLFGVALGMIVLWFAHPAKLATLADSARHPFFGTPRTIFLDFVLTWFTEYGASLAVGLFAVLSCTWAFRRRERPAVRAVLIWALLSTAFYALRGRFHFRYNFVEAPIFLLLASIALPDWVTLLGRRLGDPFTRRRRALAFLGWIGGALGLLVGLAVTLNPGALFSSLEPPFEWLYGLRDDHWGMRLTPQAYVEHFATHYAGFATYLGSSFAALSLGLFSLACGALVFAVRPGSGLARRSVAAFAFAMACLPGAVRLYGELPRMVEWELEGHPELGDVYDFVSSSGRVSGETLLAGGWDQLSNNALRWYFLTRTEPQPWFEEVRVVGDMIGSLVFPPEPRIVYWTQRLARAPGDDLPDTIVLVEPFVPPQGEFLYRTWIGPEVELYREVLEWRGGYRSGARRAFQVLGCTVEVLRRSASGAPVEPPPDLGTRAANRRAVGANGWILKDQSLRHFVQR